MSLCNLSEKTAWHAWSPCGQRIAFGTAAQQLDASFSTESFLQIYWLNFSEGISLKEELSTPVKARFQSLCWTSGDLIIGGHDDGTISIYGSDGQQKHVIDAAHTGPVRSLDANSFKPNLVCSGASDSEAHIWDFRMGF